MARATEPKTTILVPTIGRMEFLPETRRAIESQTRSDFRVVVLDNASPEPAREFLHRWATEDRRVEVRRVAERVPMFSNFNRGMRAVETELVTFFHDDDVYRPRFLETLVGLLEQHPRAAFAGSNYDFVDERGAITERRRWIGGTELWTSDRYLEELVGRGRNPVPMPGLVFRRAAFPPEGFDESLPIHFGDFILLMRAAEERGVVVAHEPVVGIRRHAGQASAAPLSEMVPLRTALFREYLDGYAARHPTARPLVGRLRRRVELSHRVAMLWGWMSAEEGAERAACLEGLGTRAVDSVLRGVCRSLESAGLRPRGGSARVGRAARRVAETLRL